LLGHQQAETYLIHADASLWDCRRLTLLQLSTLSYFTLSLTLVAMTLDFSEVMELLLSSAVLAGSVLVCASKAWA